MKKKILIIALIVLFIMTFVVLSIYTNMPIDSKLKYSQEYEIGSSNIKGEVDVSYYTNISKNFDIGANKYGYAVFKDPNAAFKTLKQKYKMGIRLIQKEFNLLPISRFNYGKYKIYGWQVTTGTIEEREQARFVSSFMDIYENSINN